jgi:hypothetical protein
VWSVNQPAVGTSLDRLSSEELNWVLTIECINNECDEYTEKFPVQPKVGGVYNLYQTVYGRDNYISTKDHITSLRSNFAVKTLRARRWMAR